eukprot:GHVS01095305.1.p1 GENE.GHVS01095305.1~~GHVS01095305.1.p1  ORF type:complete len:739 (-),score=189.27 GHVS01095305.1:343-2559(-)
MYPPPRLTCPSPPPSPQYTSKDTTSADSPTPRHPSYQPTHPAVTTDTSSAPSFTGLPPPPYHYYYGNATTQRHGIGSNQRAGDVVGSTGEGATDVGSAVVVGGSVVVCPPVYGVVGKCEMLLSDVDGVDDSSRLLWDDSNSGGGSLELLSLQLEQIRRATEQGVSLQDAMDIVMGTNRHRNGGGRSEKRQHEEDKEMEEVFRVGGAGEEIELEEIKDKNEDDLRNTNFDDIYDQTDQSSNAGMESWYSGDRDSVGTIDRSQKHQGDESVDRFASTHSSKQVNTTTTDVGSSSMLHMSHGTELASSIYSVRDNIGHNDNIRDDEKRGISADDLIDWNRCSSNNETVVVDGVVGDESTRRNSQLVIENDLPVVVRQQQQDNNNKTTLIRRSLFPSTTTTVHPAAPLTTTSYNNIRSSSQQRQRKQMHSQSSTPYFPSPSTALPYMYQSCSRCSSAAAIPTLPSSSSAFYYHDRYPVHSRPTTPPPQHQPPSPLSCHHHPLSPRQITKTSSPTTTPSSRLPRDRSCQILAALQKTKVSSTSSLDGRAYNTHHPEQFSAAGCSSTTTSPYAPPALLRPTNSSAHKPPSSSPSRPAVHSRSADTRRPTTPHGGRTTAEWKEQQTPRVRTPASSPHSPAGRSNSPNTQTVGDHVNIKLRLNFPASMAAPSSDETLTVRLPREVVGRGERLAVRIVDESNVDGKGDEKRGKGRRKGKEGDSITALVVDGEDTLAVIRVRVLEEDA